MYEHQFMNKAYSTGRVEITVNGEKRDEHCFYDNYGKILTKEQIKELMDKISGFYELYPIEWITEHNKKIDKQMDNEMRGTYEF
ncbi:coenzyme F420-reducing hydrogenase delta subunit [Neobacillus niacini]|uniref:hypothetical protein n=1 Tax=Neobacillus driksii TaxID=3035913 RepID=UPI00277E140A|nr:hypothetical protein [Neobacillus niacini]MDQ0976599.1 coenzyme F420-reducing hydrogenase delta subunit [Neobacillus niacini]